MPVDKRYRSAADEQMVEAAEVEQKNHSTHQGQDRRTNLRHQMLLHGNQPDVPIRSGENPVQTLLMTRISVGRDLRPLQSYTRLQPADDAERHVVALRPIVSQAVRNPDIGQAFQSGIWREQQFEARSQHANNLGRWTAPGGLDGLSQDPGIAAESPLPVFIADDRDGGELRRLRGIGCVRRVVSRLRLRGLGLTIRV